MNIIIAQIIVLIIMLILFFVTFKKDHTKITIKDMTLITLLCVLGAILNKTLAIKFPPAQPLFVISFAGAIAITIGILFSPKLALVAGVITDLIGLLLAPASGEVSMPFLGFTLTAMLSCYLPSVLIRITKNQKQAILKMFIVIILALANIATIIYLFSVNSISIDQTQNDLTNSLRFIIIGVVFLISVVILIINHFLNKKMKAIANLYVTTTHLILLILVVEIVCHIILTSLWINIMYGLPYIIAVATRIIKAILILPINVVIIYLILKFIPMQYKQHLIKDNNQMIE